MASSAEEGDDGLTDYERMVNLLEEKKSLLAEKKKMYSELTTAQYNASQELIRMQKAIKTQASNINSATKKYVDTNVALALAEADCEYFKGILSSRSASFDQKQEMADIAQSREHLNDKLKAYRDLKAEINEKRRNISTQNQSLRQECLNVGFYCNDLRAKMDSNVKKHLDHHSMDANSAAKKHLRGANNSAMTVANRVLDCREELLGFFKQQVLKAKREERLAQEHRDMMAEKKISMENSQAITENEVDSFVKKQKLFPSKEDSSDQHENRATSPLQPKPPAKEAPTAALGNLTANLMGRGNHLGATARQRRKERNSAFSAVNIDRIGDDLIRGCEAEGNTSKLRALKQAMQHHVLHQLTFLLLLENELNDEKVANEQIRKESGEGHSLVGGGVDSSGPAVEEETRGGASAGKKVAAPAAGHFGHSLGKLCGLNSATLQDFEGANFISSGTHYSNLLAADVVKVEAELLAAATANEEMLYKTCTADIAQPWDPSVLKAGAGHREDDVSTENTDVGAAPTTGNTGASSVSPRGYRALTIVHMRPTPAGAVLKEDRNDKSDNKNEKNFGLLKWLTIGSFEQKLSQILSTEVKSMNEIPIELGLAKLTSICHSSKQVTIVQAQNQKDRERKTLALVLQDIGKPNPEPPFVPVDRKVCIAGLEKL